MIFENVFRGHITALENNRASPDVCYKSSVHLLFCKTELGEKRLFQNSVITDNGVSSVVFDSLLLKVKNNGAGCIITLFNPIESP
jgi:hypothetical protein